MYGKLFESLFEGSMCGQPPLVFAVWTYVIAKQRPSKAGGSHHFVELNPFMLAAIFATPEAEILKAIDYLCSPDDRSRSPEKGGRRLVRDPTKDGRGPCSYVVVNGPKFRAMRDEEERREQVKLAVRRHRAKPGNQSKPGKRGKPMKAQSEAELEPESEAEPTVNPKAAADASDPSTIARATEPQPQQSPEKGQEGSPNHGKIPCPADLQLGKDQQSMLGMQIGIEPWAIKAITTSFVCAAMSDQEDKRPHSAWLKCLSKAVSGNWQDPAKRPKREAPDTESQKLAEGFA